MINDLPLAFPVTPGFQDSDFRGLFSYGSDSPPRKGCTQDWERTYRRTKQPLDTTTLAQAAAEVIACLIRYVHTYSYKTCMVCIKK